MWRDSPIVEFVTIVVRRDDVEQEDVLGLHVQAAESELHLRKHLPKNKKILLLFGAVVSKRVNNV